MIFVCVLKKELQYMMKTLLVFDKKDYTEDMQIFEKVSVRAVIRQNGRIAAQMGARGDYKLLGGGVEPDEDETAALMREVQEESGLVISPESIREIGQIVEKRRDLFEPDKIYLCRSLFYSCDITEERTEPKMTESEMEKGYHLVWAAPEEMIAGNQPFLSEPWIYRDTEFVRQFVPG